MVDLADYQHSYQNIRFARSDGVLEMVFHSDGGPMLWNAVMHRELGEAFHRVAEDTENRVVVLTGSGDAFCPGSDRESFQLDATLPPIGLDNIYREGKAILFNQLAVPVPMIAAVNGPVMSHPELPLLCDIVLAAETAEFRDSHLARGLVPGDGIHVVFPMVFGVNRGRYLALTGTAVTAREALEWGAVNEVLPVGLLRERALEIARELADKPLLSLRYTRELLTREIKRQLHDNLGYGLALEGFASGYGAWTNASDETSGSCGTS